MRVEPSSSKEACLRLLEDPAAAEAAAEEAVEAAVAKTTLQKEISCKKEVA